MKTKITLLIFLILPILLKAQMHNSTEYIHQKPISLKAHFWKTSISLAGMKNKIEKALNSGSFSQEAAKIPKSLLKKSDLTIKEHNGNKVWTFTPKEKKSEKVLLFLHGGAYVFNLTSFHWKLIEELMIKSGITIVVPDYPLAPASNYNDVFTFLSAVYNGLTSNTPAKKIILMGDSAGGGLALAFAQNLRDKNMDQVSDIVLLSPWLDVSMTNAEILEVDKKDHLLGIKGLQMAGKAYASGTDIKNFLVSPLYGNFERLGEISLFIGTHDILYPDCKKLKEMFAQQNRPLRYYEYPGMFHDWVIFTDLKESKDAIGKMLELVEN